MRILRLRELTKIVGLSKVTIWRMEREGTFPRRRQLSSGSVGWLDEEVEEWMRERPVAKLKPLDGHFLARDDKEKDPQHNAH